MLIVFRNSADVPSEHDWKSRGATGITCPNAVTHFFSPIKNAVSKIEKRPLATNLPSREATV